MSSQVMSAMLGDITEVEVDAIVNAANSSLLGGSGVDGAIHRMGGPEILNQCLQLRSSQFPKGLETGDAVATTAGELPSRWVIHTVGPVYASAGPRAPELLANCHRSCLHVAAELGAKTLAFPAISTGVYGYPLAAAAKVAIATVRRLLPRYPVIEEVRFVLFSPKALATYQDQLDDLAAQIGDEPAE